MFGQIDLWEVGILLIGISFIVGAIYLARTFRSINKTIEDIDSIVYENKEIINSIAFETEAIVKNASVMVEDFQESVDSIKNSVNNVEKTVKNTKNYMLVPLYKVVNLAYSTLKFYNSIKFKKNKTKK